jgi:hypothetical protein
MYNFAILIPLVAALGSHHNIKFKSMYDASDLDELLIQNEIRNKGEHIPMEKYFDTKIDQFDENSEEFKIRYLLNNQFNVDDQGPIFLFVGGEGSIW